MYLLPIAFYFNNLSALKVKGCTACLTSAEFLNRTGE